MANYNEKVMQMVEAELEKNPEASAQELQEKAKKISRNVGKLSSRQFHAQYPLQVKRRKNRAARGSAPKAKTPRRPRKTAAPRRSTAPRGGGDLDREAIRDLFLKFASDITAANDSRELVGVLSKMNRYVDEVARIVG